MRARSLTRGHGAAASTGAQRLAPSPLSCRRAIIALAHDRRASARPPVASSLLPHFPAAITGGAMAMAVAGGLLAIAGVAPAPGGTPQPNPAAEAAPVATEQQCRRAQGRRSRGQATPASQAAARADNPQGDECPPGAAGASAALPSLALASIMAATTMQHSAPAPTASIVPATGPVREALYKLHYRTLQVLALPTYGKVATLFLVGVPLLVGGAVVYRRVTGTDWGESLLKVYYLLMAVPGIDVSAEASKRAVFVLNLVHLASLFTFATLVGVVSEEISTAVEQVRAGNHKVPESGHTVLLGWDDRRTPLLLQQLLVGEAERGPGRVRTPFVVLLDPAHSRKESVDALLEEMLGHQLGRAVVTRVGSPQRAEDLERVSAGQAATVIITGPRTWGGSGGAADAAAALGSGAEGGAGGGAGSDSVEQAGTTRLLACLAALHSVSEPGTSQSVILDQDVLDLPPTGGGGNGDARAAAAAAAEGASGDVAVQAAARLLAGRSRQLTTVTALKELADMLALTVFNPGLAAVFEDVCVHSETSGEFYIHPGDDLAGRSILELRRRFHEAVVCGTVDARTGVCRLNASDGYRLKPHDRLVLLSADARTASMQVSLSREEQRAADEEASAIAAAAAASSDGNGGGVRGLLRRRRAGDAQQFQQQQRLLRANSMSLNTTPSSNPHRQQHVVVVMNEANREVVQLLNSMAEAGQHLTNLRITLVGKAAPPQRDPDGLLTYEVEQALARARRLGASRCAASWVRGDAAHLSTLLSAGVAGAQAVVVAPGPPGDDGTQDVDAQVLAHTLRLVEVLHRQHQQVRASPAAGGGGEAAAGATASADCPAPGGGGGHAAHVREEPLRLVASIREESTRQVLESVTAGNLASEGGNYAVMPELLLQDKIMSGLLGQVTLEPQMQGVFEELLSQAGAEIYTRPPERFGLPIGKELAWSEVTEVVRAQNELAVGLVSLSTDGAAHLGLPLSTKVVLRPRDRLVVLADE